MKVGLFFGTFDPLHIGHDQIASYFLENYFDQIWFVVTPHNPHKEKLVLTDEKIRLEMVKKFCDSNVNFICSDVEFSLKQPNHTSDTVSKLLEMHPKIDFSAIIGQDNLMHLDQWKNYERILDIGVYVYPRDIESELNGPLESHPNVKICDCKLMEISSSEIRDNISKGLNINHLVPDQVIELINKNKLYAPSI